MDKYWEIYKEDLEIASTLEYVAAVANAVLAQMQKTRGSRIVQICGPMTTGGLGSAEANMLLFRRAIAAAEAHGLIVFDQTNLGGVIARLERREKERRGGDGYYMEILGVLYYRVFKSGCIWKGLFLPDWQSSTSASWEREQFAKFGILIGEYPMEWLESG